MPAHHHLAPFSRGLLAPFLLAGLLLALAGCGGSDKAAPDATAPAAPMAATPTAPKISAISQTYCGSFSVTGEMAGMLAAMLKDADCTPVADGQGSGVIRYVGMGDVADAAMVKGEKTGSYVIRVSAYIDLLPHPLPVPAKLKVEGRRIGAGEEAALSTPETTILAMSRSAIPGTPTRNFLCVLAAKASAAAPQLRILICREIAASAKDAAARDVAHQIIQRLLPDVTALPLKSAG